jgi:molybdopterin-guanine dinucleotide biosynthesis protein A
MIESWDAAILAGGRSHRLGGCDKALLPLGRARIVDRLVEALAPLVNSVLIVSNRPDAQTRFGWPVINDRTPGLGVLAGLDAALHASRAAGVLFVACDLPFLTTPFLARLQALASNAAVAIPRSPDGRHALVAAVTRRCHPIVERCLREGRLQFREFLRDVPVAELRMPDLAAFDPDGRLLLNINTPHAYGQALATLEHDCPASYPQGHSQSIDRHVGPGDLR